MPGMGRGLKALTRALTRANGPGKAGAGPGGCIANAYPEGGQGEAPRWHTPARGRGGAESEQAGTFCPAAASAGCAPRPVDPAQPFGLAVLGVACSWESSGAGWGCGVLVLQFGSEHLCNFCHICNLLRCAILQPPTASTAPLRVCLQRYIYVDVCMQFKCMTTRFTCVTRSTCAPSEICCTAPFCAERPLQPQQPL